MKKIILLISMFLILAVSVLGYSDNTISYYNFSTDANDYFGRHNGTPNTPTLTGTYRNYSISGDGSPNSYYFDGNDYITIDNPSEIINQMGGGNWSVSMDIKDANIGTTDRFLTYGTGGTNYIIFELETDGGIDVKSATNWYFQGVSNLYQQGIWFNLVVTYDADINNLTIFINGNQRSTTTATGFSTTGDTLYIGRDQGSTFFNGGFIDNVAFFNKTLTPTEILQINETGIIFDATTQPPTVTINTPLNDTNINTATDINFTLNDGTINSDCDYYINDVLKESRLSLSTNTYEFNFNSTIWSEGNNLINVSCNNTEGESSDTINLFVDTVTPSFDYIKVCQGSDGLCFDINNSFIDENLIWNVSASDTNLYSFNVSVCHNNDLTDCEYTDYVNNIGATNYVYDNVTDLGIFIDEGLLYFGLEICDGHTDKINDLVAIKNKNKYNVGTITFEGLDTDILSSKANKEYDRISFDFDYDKPKNFISFSIKSIYDIIQVKNSNYKGHFVTGNQWIDFENFEGFEVYTVNYVNNNEVIVTLKSISSKSKVKLKSIGIINCKSLILSAIIDGHGLNISLSVPVNETSFITETLNKTLNFTYNPESVSDVDNCTLYINSSVAGFDDTISKNLDNTFVYNVLAYPQQNLTYNWFIECEQSHLHPPLYEEPHTSTSETFTFYLYSSVSTTTTSTTTTTIPETPPNEDLRKTGFDSIEEGLFYIFLFMVWVVLIYLTFTLKGKHNETPQILNLAQGFLGFFVGINYLSFSGFFGLIVMFTSVSILFGKWLE